jgi:MOSC domain-containing protein YiiM
MNRMSKRHLGTGSLLRRARRWRPSPWRFAGVAAGARNPGPLLALDTHELQEQQGHDSGPAAPREHSAPDSGRRPVVGRLLSVNVGMPKNVPWQGKTVFTGVFKDPVSGPRRVGKLNVEGDGQGDLAGHGGEQRAVFVYQIASYRYWERELGRDDFVYGQFGENFTVEGLGDNEVCIGDRYQIGTAAFEVTQPRVTCYRVGIRMNDARIPALLVSHHRPGFYFRVLEEGEVQAGDEIIKLGSGPEQMPVAEADAMLYLPGHQRQEPLRALRIPALSPGWQASFQALLDEEPGSGNAGLAVTSPPPAWSGFRQLSVTGITREADSVISTRLEDRNGAPLPPARPGQYLTLRVRPTSSKGQCSATTPCPDRRRRLLPDHRQARTGRCRQRLSPHPARRRRPTRHRGAPRHLHPRPD